MDYLAYCQPCGARCCYGEAPYFSDNPAPVPAHDTFGADTPCRFLNKDNLCSIYHHRPLECRLYPYDIIRLNGALHWIKWLSCPLLEALSERDMENIGEHEQVIHKHYSPDYVNNYVHYHEKLALPKYRDAAFATIRPVIFPAMIREPENKLECL